MYIQYILSVNAANDRACQTARPELVGGRSRIEVVPRERHPLVFSTFAGLNPGEGFILIADHDPRPLRRQFEAQCTNQFSWDYLEQGQAVWRVRIGRLPLTAKSAMETRPMSEQTISSEVGLVAEWRSDMHANLRHMTRKESEPDDQTLRPGAGGLIVITLADETAKLDQTVASNGRRAVSLVKDGPLNVLLMTLKKGAELSEHRTRGPITVHVISGAIRFHAESQQVTLAAGCVFALDRDVAQSVTALENSSVLLTTAIA